MAQEVLKISNEILMKYVCESLAVGKSVTIRVRGDSMLPFLRDNKDCVTLKAVNKNYHFKNGDIILFHYHGRFLLHRIIHQYTQTLYVRGDNRWTQGYEIITPEAVIGLVTSVNRNGRGIVCDTRRWKWVSRFWMTFIKGLSYLHHMYSHCRKFFSRTIINKNLV